MKIVWRCNLEMEFKGGRLQARREGRRIDCAKAVRISAVGLAMLGAGSCRALKYSGRGSRKAELRLIG